MNNERYNQIIDEVYKNYKHYFENKYGNYITGKITKEDGDYLIVNKHPLPQETILSIIYSKEEFIRKCKTDSEFSERWGLKIEERVLTWEEKVQWVMKNTDVEWENLYIVEEIAKDTTPKRLLTVTCKEEKTEVYE